jgi:predicted nucleic acid-binding protein
MPDGYRRVYWDANVFLAYINGEAAHMPMLDALLDESRRANIVIVTSVLSITEVAYAATEKEQQALDPAVEEAIDKLFADREVVRVSEYHELIARDARALIRDAITNGWSLKPFDAVHLATARRLSVAEFHTFDGPLQKYAGPLDFPIHAPHTNAPRLPIDESAPSPVLAARSSDDSEAVASDSDGLATDDESDEQASEGESPA